MFDRMSLIHSAHNSSKTVRDGECFMVPFLRIQIRLTFHTYSIRLAPKNYLAREQEIGIFSNFHATFLFKEFTLCLCLCVTIQNNLTRMPVSLCKVKTFITSTVLDIME
jgi:hypothetical protein